MLLVAVAVVGLAALVAIAIAGHRDGVFPGAEPARAHNGNTAVDEAERILAQRYAKGEITATEYNRMLVILRR